MAIRGFLGGVSEASGLWCRTETMTRRRGERKRVRNWSIHLNRNACSCCGKAKFVRKPEVLVF